MSTRRRARRRSKASRGSSEQPPRRRMGVPAAIVSVLFILGVTTAAVLYANRDALRPASGPRLQSHAPATAFLEDAPLTLADDAGPMIVSRGARVMQTEPFVQDASGRRQRVPLELTVDSQGRLMFSGGLSNPRVRIYGTARREEGHTWVLSFVQEADQDLIGVDFGLRFQFDLESPVFVGIPTAPRLEGNQGWSWPIEKTYVQYSCLVTAASPSVQQPEPGVIDLFLHTGSIPRESSAAIVRLRAPMPWGVRMPNAERRGPVQASAWPGGLLDHEASPVDLRFLNHTPAGSKGFVRAENGALVFEDGTPARFWGTNMAAYALFMDHETIDRHAERIARLGYNLVRMHHHDSMQWVRPTVIDLERADSRRLDLDAMDRFDYWVAALKQRGVYVWLDLHTGRIFKPGDRDSVPGGIPGFDEIEAQEGYGTILNYLNPGLQALMAEFNEQFLWHRNAYTGNAYVDEPAIAGIAITNENNLTGPLANRLLPERRNPAHAALLSRRLTEFAIRTGRRESDFTDWWRPGPGKLFLNAVEAAFHREVLAQLEVLGVRVPVITTQYWSAGVQSSSWALPALAQGDAIAVHSYGNGGFLERNPAYESNFVLNIAGGRVAGKPLVVTEWSLNNRPADRVHAPLYMAAVGALQGWSGMFEFTYAQHAIDGRDTTPAWATLYDPGYHAMAPAAALLYRRGDLPAPEESALIEMDEAALLAGVDATSSAAVRLLAERMPVALHLPSLPALDWHAPSPELPGAVRFEPGSETIAQTGTGALQRDWERGLLTVDTPRSQVAMGWLGGERLALSNAVIAITTTMAAVAISSLTDAPIAESDAVLVSVAGRAVLSQGHLPFRSEPIAGEIALDLAGSVEAWRCLPLSGSGDAGEPIPLRQDGSAVVLALPAEGFTHWYRLERAPRGQ